MVHIDKTEPMDKTQIKLLQQVCRTFLYYARVVDCTMLHALNNLSTRVTDGTQTTVKAVKHFLDYYATNSEATVLYQASDMILHNHSDAAYLVVTQARSRAGGYTFLGNKNNRQQIHSGPATVIVQPMSNWWLPRASDHEKPCP